MSIAFHKNVVAILQKYTHKISNSSSAFFDQIEYALPLYRSLVRHKHIIELLDKSELLFKKHQAVIMKL